MKIKLPFSTLCFWVLLVLFFATTQIMLGNYFGPRETGISIILFILLYRWKKWIGYTFLGVTFSCALLYGFVGLTYGHLDKNAVDALLFTNHEEAWEYASSVPVSVLAWYGALIVFSLGIIGYLRRHPFFLQKTGPGTVMACLALLLALSSSTYLKNLSRGIPSHWWDLKSTEIHFTHSVYSAVRSSSQGQSKYSIFNRHADWQASSEEGINTYVLILGESARRDFFGAYGAPWTNTPWLSQENGILFQNYLSASAGTAPSLSRQLYLRSEEADFNPAYNLITLAKSAGFHTVWISAQGERGGADSPISVVAKMADKYTFIADNLNPLNKVIKKTDEDLLEPFQEALAHPGKKLIVLHLLGSHPQACRRTDDRYTEFFRSEELSCYIESLRNTDRLAQSVTDALKQEEKLHGRQWRLLFTADHGLDFTTDQNGWCLKHMDKRQGSYEVPMFITGSDYHDRQTVEAFRSGIDFLPFAASWMKITSDKLPDNDCQWLQDSVCRNQDYVFRYSGEKVRFHDLPKFDLNTFIQENP